MAPSSRILTAHLQAIRQLLKALSYGLLAFDITVHVSGTYHRTCSSMTTIGRPYLRIGQLHRQKSSRVLHPATRQQGRVWHLLFSIVRPACVLPTSGSRRRVLKDRAPTQYGGVYKCSPSALKPILISHRLSTNPE